MSKLKKEIIFIVLATVGLSVTSCKKWLEVQPEDKFTQEQMYQTSAGVSELVNGFYLKMSNGNLYGHVLTMTVMDVLAQRYRMLNTESGFYNMSRYDYSQNNAQQTISSIWSNMYANIANINDFVKILPTVENGMTEAQKNQYLGEAIALRAFSHFDLLRLFGPIYNEGNKTKEAIPYVRSLSTEIQPFLSAEAVLNEIITDIETAEKLLVNDPIHTQLSTDNYKNNRFNYFALKALEARVYQWMGNRSKALEAAKVVIAAQERFPWVTHAAITANGANPDRKFFSEIIFGLFYDKLYETQLEYFDSNLLESDILATGSDSYVSTVYEGNESDYRLTYHWPYASTGVGFRTFVKYVDLPEKKIKSRFIVPIIRISEMYYIAAESTDDQTEALLYLNTVRKHRNILTEITDYAQLRNELTKEYLKEFYGEGQLWYYYKRNQMTSIMSMSTSDHKQTISISNYQFPLPQEELNGR